MRVRPGGVLPVGRARRIRERLLAQEQERPLRKAVPRRRDRASELVLVAGHMDRASAPRLRRLPKGSARRAPSRPSPSPGHSGSGEAARRTGAAEHPQPTPAAHAASRPRSPYACRDARRPRCVRRRPGLPRSRSDPQEQRYGSRRRAGAGSRPARPSTAARPPQGSASRRRAPSGSDTSRRLRCRRPSEARHRGRRIHIAMPADPRRGIVASPAPSPSPAPTDRTGPLRSGPYPQVDGSHRPAVGRGRASSRESRRIRRSKAR